jgi:Flp pilus assembly pilin Flp
MAVFAPRARARAKLLTRRLRGDERGFTAVEFAIVAVPFLLLLIGLISVSLYFFTNFTMESAVLNARPAPSEPGSCSRARAPIRPVHHADQGAPSRPSCARRHPPSLTAPTGQSCWFRAAARFGGIVEPNCADQRHAWSIKSTAHFESGCGESRWCW